MASGSPFIVCEPPGIPEREGVLVKAVAAYMSVKDPRREGEITQALSRSYGAAHMGFLRSDHRYNEYYRFLLAAYRAMYASSSPLQATCATLGVSRDAVAGAKGGSWKLRRALCDALTGSSTDDGTTQLFSALLQRGQASEVHNFDNFRTVYTADLSVATRCEDAPLAKIPPDLPEAFGA